MDLSNDQLLGLGVAMLLLGVLGGALSLLTMLRFRSLFRRRHPETWQQIRNTQSWRDSLIGLNPGFKALNFALEKANAGTIDPHVKRWARLNAVILIGAGLLVAPGFALMMIYKQPYDPNAATPACGYPDSFTPSPSPPVQDLAQRDPATSAADTTRESSCAGSNH